jgi:hypothetical protein
MRNISKTETFSYLYPWLPNTESFSAYNKTKDAPQREKFP